MQVISGLNKPQGLGYHPPTDSLYVANGGDGTAAIFRGGDYRAITRIPLGKDSDNVRTDTVGNRGFVADCDGALAGIQRTTRKKGGDMRVQVDTENFSAAQE